MEYFDLLQFAMEERYMMMEKISRRNFLKVMGLAGTACVMTVLTGCDDSTTVPAGDGSVPLSDLKPFNGSVVWNNVVPEDPFGNTYSSSSNHMVFRSYKCGWEKTRFEYVHFHDMVENTFCGTVEYNLNKKYSKLTMKLNPYKEIGEKGWGLIRIYADNKLVATSPEIRQKNKDTVEFEVDIKSVEYLKIEPVVTPAFSTEYDGEIIIRDVKLWP